MVVDLTVAYVALSFSLLLMPFKQAPFVYGRWIGGMMLILVVHPSEIVWSVAPRPRPSASSLR